MFKCRVEFEAGKKTTEHITFDYEWCSQDKKKPRFSLEGNMQFQETADGEFLLSWADEVGGVLYRFNSDLQIVDETCVRHKDDLGDVLRSYNVPIRGYPEVWSFVEEKAKEYHLPAKKAKMRVFYLPTGNVFVVASHKKKAQIGFFEK